MFSTCKQLKSHEAFKKNFKSVFQKKEKWNLTKLYLVITISTIFELLGILSIFPILALITDPVLLEKINSINWLKYNQYK